MNTLRFLLTYLLSGLLSLNIVAAVDSVQIQAVNPVCDNECTGTISLSIYLSGGGTYTAEITGNGPTCFVGLTPTSFGFQGICQQLCSGLYTIKVLDTAYAVVFQDSVQLSGAPLHSTTFDVTPSCNGVDVGYGCNGAIDPTTTGGTPPYYYHWGQMAGLNFLSVVQSFDTAIFAVCGFIDVLVWDSLGCSEHYDIPIPDVWGQPYANDICQNAQPICSSGDSIGGNHCGNSNQTTTCSRDFWYVVYIPDTTYSLTLSFCGMPALQAEASMDIFGPFQTLNNNCQSIYAGATPEVDTSNFSSYATSDVSNTLPPGYHIIKINAICRANVCISSNGIECIPPTPCSDCLTSFRPDPGKKYVISAWVKEGGVSSDIETYTDPSIELQFDLNGSTVMVGPFNASGKIIDGWQRIEAVFTIPVAAPDMQVDLLCASVDCFFDDVRIFPFDGSMKSYVYDPETLRFIAELDERNYATFYEYDEEGKLIRTKKETERGIMTIQESRNNIYKP